MAQPGENPRKRVADVGEGEGACKRQRTAFAAWCHALGVEPADMGGVHTVAEVCRGGGSHATRLSARGRAALEEFHALGAAVWRAACDGSEECLERALSAAAERGGDELQRAAAQWTVRDTPWNTAVHAAAGKGRAWVVKRLGAFFTRSELASVFARARRECAYAVCAVLVEAGVDSHACDVRGVSVLHEAVSAGHVAAVRTLLPLFDVNGCCAQGTSPLMAACTCMHAGGEMVSLLLAAGADVELTDSFGHNALHYACVHGRTAVVRRLLAAGAAVSVRNNHGNTPLHIACIGDHTDAVRALLEHGAPLDADLQRVLMTSVRLHGGPVDTSVLLIRSGAKVTEDRMQAWSWGQSGVPREVLAACFEPRIVAAARRDCARLLMRWG